MLVEVVGMLYAQNKEHLQIKYGHSEGKSKHAFRLQSITGPQSTSWPNQIQHPEILT